MNESVDCSPSSSHPGPVLGIISRSALCGPVSKHFLIGESLGRGSFGEVLTVRDKKSDSMACVRIMRPHKNMNRRKLTKQIVNNMAEIDKYLKICHENLIGYKSLILTGTPDIKGLGLVMNPGMASVRSLLPLSSSETCFVVHGMANGLAFLHARGLIHGHVCSESVFLDDYGVVKMSDYGMFLFDSKSGRTTPWSPPEARSKSLVERMKSPSASCDIWCLGITACHFILGDLPFKPYNLNSPFTKLPMEIRNSLLGRVVYSCLHLEPEARVTADVLMRSSEMKEMETQTEVGLELLTRVHIRPELRAQARDRLGCDSCGEDSGYSPVMLNHHHGSEFLCDNCLEEASGHQNCRRQTADCRVCSELGETLRQRWRRQRSLDAFFRRRGSCETPVQSTDLSPGVQTVKNTDQQVEVDATNDENSVQIQGVPGPLEMKDGEQNSQEAVTIPNEVEKNIVEELNNNKSGSQYELRPKRMIDCCVCFKKASSENGIVQKESGSFICEKCIAEANSVY